MVATPAVTDPSEAVATELRQRGVALPDDWRTAYREPHEQVEPGRERSLVAHARDTLASRGVEVRHGTVHRAVRAAFEKPVETRLGARAAVTTAAERGSVAVLSNCSVPGLVERTLRRSTVDESLFDAVVASVDSGWRKPHRRAFEAVATATETRPADLIHVGDDPETDGGVSAVGGRAILVDETPLTNLSDRLTEAR
nr:HAD family hydrolase [Halomarina salina]